MDELIFSSATHLAEAIRDKKVSSAEVVDACVRRIEEVNPKLNAVVQLNAETARSQAREADESLARGEIKGPLHGVPMTTKDALDIRGVVTTGGTMGRASRVAREDATTVARLGAAGAIMLGNTNVPELCLAGESDNLIYTTSLAPLAGAVAARRPSSPQADLPPDLAVTSREAYVGQHTAAESPASCQPRGECREPATGRP